MTRDRYRQSRAAGARTRIVGAARLDMAVFHTQTRHTSPGHPGNRAYRRAGREPGRRGRERIVPQGLFIFWRNDFALLMGRTGGDTPLVEFRTMGEPAGTARRCEATGAVQICQDQRL